MCGFNGVKHERMEACETREEVKAKARARIEAFYNRLRLQSSLGYNSPVPFMRDWDNAWQAGETHPVTNGTWSPGYFFSARSALRTTLPGSPGAIEAIWATFFCTTAPTDRLLPARASPAGFPSLVARRRHGPGPSRWCPDK